MADTPSSYLSAFGQKDFSFLRSFGILLVLVGLIVIPFLITQTELRLATTILIWGLFAVGFNLIFGYTGMVSFGHGAFFGVGMYAVAFVYTYTGFSNTVLVLVIACLAVTLLGIIIGIISTVARGIQFAILTFISGEIVQTIFFHLTSVTGGSNGLSFTIPSLSIVPGLLEFSAYKATPNYYLVLFVTVLAVALMVKLVNSPLGAVLKGIRENPERINYLGYNERMLRILSFSISAGFAGLAGGLLAITTSFVGPSILGLQTHANVIIYTILGGTGSVFGPIIGSAGVLFLQNWLAAEVSWWTIPLGLIFIFVMIFMPEGITGKIKAFRE